MNIAPTTKAEVTRQAILDTGFELVLRKGFTGLGLQEILKTTGVPKGSFYYYFASKEAFGCALIEAYARDYSAGFDAVFAADGGDSRDRLMRYWQSWIQNGGAHEGGLADRCLVVKLAAEVADLSDGMRLRLRDATAGLIARLRDAIAAGRREQTLAPGPEPEALARTLLELWLGAALLAKLDRSRMPLESALHATATLLPRPG